VPVRDGELLSGFILWPPLLLLLLLLLLSDVLREASANTLQHRSCILQIALPLHLLAFCLLAHFPRATD